MLCFLMWGGCGIGVVVDGGVCCEVGLLVCFFVGG